MAMCFSRAEIQSFRHAMILSLWKVKIYLALSCQLVLIWISSRIHDWISWNYKSIWLCNNQRDFA